MFDIVLWAFLAFWAAFLAYAYGYHQGHTAAFWESCEQEFRSYQCCDLGREEEAHD